MGVSFWCMGGVESLGRFVHILGFVSIIIIVAYHILSARVRRARQEKSVEKGGKPSTAPVKKKEEKEKEEEEEEEEKKNKPPWVVCIVVGRGCPPLLSLIKNHLLRGCRDYWKVGEEGNEALTDWSGAP